MNRNAQRGFTLPELIFAIAGILVLCAIPFTFYVIYHFISKFW